jgi:hypothetical protein
MTELVVRRGPMDLQHDAAPAAAWLREQAASYIVVA